MTRSLWGQDTLIGLNERGAITVRCVARTRTSSSASVGKESVRCRGAGVETDAIENTPLSVGVESMICTEREKRR